MKYSVYLRPFKIEDAEKINNWRNTEEIYHFTGGRFRFVSLEMERKWIMDKMTNNIKNEYFAICLNDDSQEIIGYIGLTDIDIYNLSGFINGPVFGLEHRKSIFVIDTMKQILEYGFMHIGLNRMTGGVLDEHINSKVMNEMMGFSFEGIAKEAIYKRHKYHDLWRYAILYSDWKRLNEEGEYDFAKITKRAAEALKKLRNKD